jgi:sulfoxide reductase catalytic subunit YedY
MKRREFLKTSIAASAALLGSTALSAAETHQPNETRKVSKYAFPEKRPLITYSDRPPLLETLYLSLQRHLLQMINFLFDGTFRIFQRILILIHILSISMVW